MPEVARSPSSSASLEGVDIAASQSKVSKHLDFYCRECYQCEAPHRGQLEPLLGLPPAVGGASDHQGRLESGSA